MTLPADNPLAEKSHLPYQLPDFAHLTPQHFREAVTAGMAQQRASLASVAADTDPATVENVLHRYEASSELLDRALLAFYAVWLSYSSPELDALNEEFSPELAQHSDAIVLDRALFDRFSELATRAQAGEVELEPQDAYLLAETIGSFTRAGVALDDEDQEKLRALNTRLAELGTQFQQANRDGRVAGAVEVTERDELDGLADSEIDALATPEGTWRIELVNTTQQPLLAKLRHRPLRQRLYQASVNRGLAGEHDVRGVIVEIVAPARRRRRSWGTTTTPPSPSRRAAPRPPRRSTR